MKGVHDYFKEAKAEQRTARWQAVLYGLRNDLHRPELRLPAYGALLNLLDPEHSASLQRIKEIQNTTVLLNHNTILKLAARALQQSIIINENEKETELMKLLSTNQPYWPSIMAMLCQSQAFVAELKREYPQKTAYVVIEELLLAKPQSCAHNIPMGEQEPVTQKHLTHYAEEMSRKSLEKGIDEAVEQMRAQLNSNYAKQFLAQEELPQISLEQGVDKVLEEVQVQIDSNDASKLFTQNIQSAMDKACPVTSVIMSIETI